MAASDPLQGIVSQDTSSSGDLPISPDGLGAMSPEDRLKAAEAAEKLRQMGMRDAADLIVLVEKLTEERFKKMDERIQSLDNLIKQAMELRDLYLQDAETQYAITRVFQERLVITEKIEDGKPIQAKIEPASGTSSEK